MGGDVNTETGALVDFAERMLKIDPFQIHEDRDTSTFFNHKTGSTFTVHRHVIPRVISCGTVAQLLTVAESIEASPLRAEVFSKRGGIRVTLSKHESPNNPDDGEVLAECAFSMPPAAWLLTAITPHCGSAFSPREFSTFVERLRAMGAGFVGCDLISVARTLKVTRGEIDTVSKGNANLGIETAIKAEVESVLPDRATVVIDMPTAVHDGRGDVLTTVKIDLAFVWLDSKVEVYSQGKVDDIIAEHVSVAVKQILAEQVEIVTSTSG